MKSIIQEGSSIAKAIELGWEKAGKPKDFNVKIFEEPQKNFLGFTTKNAKVGVFIDDASRSHSHPRRQGQTRPFRGRFGRHDRPHRTREVAPEIQTEQHKIDDDQRE